MCGIFGTFLSDSSESSMREAKFLMNELFQLSESRGKEASGLAAINHDSIFVTKDATAPSDLILRDTYAELYRKTFINGSKRPHSIGLMGHSRLVTNGAHQVHSNNQPVVAHGIVGIHNGIITNVDKLWEQFPELTRTSGIDTEILISLIRKFYNEEGCIRTSLQKSFDLIEGSASIALFFEDKNNVLLFTNNGSLYFCPTVDKEEYVFASERHIIEQLFKKKKLRQQFNGDHIQQLVPNFGYLIDLEGLDYKEIRINEGANSASRDEGSPLPLELKSREVLRTTTDISPTPDAAPMGRIPGEGPYILSPSFVDQFPKNADIVKKLKRCGKCILPETMPFILFDEHGTCNYCHSYKKQEFKGLDALKEAVEPFRKNNGRPDCLVTFSGGRDSSYGVHFVKQELGLNLVTYTYDWGMVTDLARRNQMRLCGKLGIEHILVSADIAKKRDNIRKNVSAWLRTPNLGMVPLFMAGDKQYFYYANKVGEQTECETIVFCENMLETTRFKSGFCGVAPRHDAEHTYSLTMSDKFKMAFYYGWRFLKNPAFINSSVLDTTWAFACYYAIPHNYLNLFDYIPWDEETINKTLIGEYNWETATDTKSTWRIGDGTAAFYNYIYYTLAGITENDTFRSNQIREGMITRDEALTHIETDNSPRYESMQWYCDIIGLDFSETIKTINKAPKLYAR